MNTRPDNNFTRNNAHILGQAGAQSQAQPKQDDRLPLGKSFRVTAFFPTREVVYYAHDRKMGVDGFGALGMPIAFTRTDIAGVERSEDVRLLGAAIEMAVVDVPEWLPPA